jgi:hypothetical protein
MRNFISRKILAIRLYFGIKTGYLVDISNVRIGIGKTSLLVKLARKHNAIIICPNMFYAFNLNRNSGVETMSYSKNLDGVNKPLLIEEGVPLKYVTDAMEKGHNILTGYYTGLGGKVKCK